MAWFRMDDKFHSHPKVIAAGNAACGLFARAGCWCSDHSSDGVIPFPVASLFGKPKEIASLLAVGLWAKTDEGYVMPDFLEFNPSKEEVEAQRAKRAEAGSRGGMKSRPPGSKSQASASSLLGGSFPVASVASEAKSNPDPTRPDPLLVQVSRQTDSLDTREVVVCRALELYADSQTPGPHVADVGKWRRGVIRNARTEHAATISGNPDATDTELAGLMLGTTSEPRHTWPLWYVDPSCEHCGGDPDGLVNFAPEGAPAVYGPCPCRRTEPYEQALAQIIEFKQATA